MTKFGTTVLLIVMIFGHVHLIRRIRQELKGNS